MSSLGEFEIQRYQFNAKPVYVSQQNLADTDYMYYIKPDTDNEEDAGNTGLARIMEGWAVIFVIFIIYITYFILSLILNRMCIENDHII